MQILGTEDKMEIKHSLLRTFVHRLMESIGELFAVYFPGRDLIYMCFKWLNHCGFSPSQWKKRGLPAHIQLEGYLGSW